MRAGKDGPGELDDAPIATRSSAPVRVATHQGTCQILDLNLVPLHLDLLGLGSTPPA